MANDLLAPTIKLLRSATGDPGFDIYQLFNWMYVSYYWIFLSDFGQIAPTYYDSTPSGTGPDFSSPIFYSSTNNIFINQSLFRIYSSYLNNTIMPVLIQLGYANPLPEFLPLDSDNILKPVNMSFVRSYSCLQRQLKGGLSVVVSVLVADYAFIAGAYTLVVFCAGWRGRKLSDGKYPYN